MTINLGLDAGNGAFKIFGKAGGLEVLSQVAINGGLHVAATLGLRTMDAPLNIKNGNGSFYIGAGAHDYGVAVENLDTERFSGTPEMVALFQGAMTKYQQQYGAFTEPLVIAVGLPQEVLTGENAEATKAGVKQWLKGRHTWTADGQEYSLEVDDVRVALQVSGGVFDYLLDNEGKFILSRSKAYTGEVGIVSVGHGTIELMVIRDRALVPGLTGAAGMGVRRLLEIMDGQKLYSRGEMDIRLRSGQLDISAALPVWEGQVQGVIEDKWRNKIWRRFSVVLVVGGGAWLLRNTLPLKFSGKGFMPDQPVMSIARGLYKMSMRKKD